MKEPVWLLESAVLAVHSMTIARFGGTDGVRDRGLLESALARPSNIYQYDHSAQIAQLAAAYAGGIIQNHPFVDGNKRTGLARLEGFEPPTAWFVARYSIQLSYRRVDVIALIGASRQL